MLWLRNLLFLGLIAGGAIGLRASLFPPPTPPRVKNFDAHAPELDDLQAVAAKVDAAFRQDWKEHGMTPAPQAPELAVARRLSLALVGSIPSLQEIRQFEAYRGEQRLQWWTAGLLQDRRYGDYWAERLARVFVGTEDGPAIIYRRRRFVAWLSDELMKNDSYGRLVHHLITEQGLWTDKPATNFLTAVHEDTPKGKRPNPEKLAGRVARAFLGIRLDCAQCHDHPFTTWKQRHFQGLAAFFGQTWQGLSGTYDGAGDFEVENRKTGKTEIIAPAVPFRPELLPEDGNRRQRLARWVTDPRNPYFSRAMVQRVWALLFGRPLMDTVEPMDPDGEHPQALDILADDFAAHDFDLQRLIRIIAATEIFRQDSASDRELTEDDERAWAVFPLTRLRPEQVAGGVFQAGSVKTVDLNSNIFVRAMRAGSQNEFVHRYGDTGDDEFDGRAGTIPQRLLLMNGQLVFEKTKDDFANAVTRIAQQAPNDRSAIEVAYLSVLTRRPTPEEADYFARRLEEATGPERARRLEDLYWNLLNSTEFSWNH